MNFLNPLFFLGALAAAVPILLHLVKREHGRKVLFPSLMFLRKISKKIVRYQRLRHLLLLFLRILALLCIVLAFMRPFLETSGPAAVIGRVTTAHVILLDHSMSMGYLDRWDQAKKAASDIVESAGEGDRFAVLEFSDQTVARTGLTMDPAEALYQIEKGTELSDRPTRYGQALKSAESVALDAETGKRVIYLISDFQRNGWAAEEQALSLSPGIELEAVDVGGKEYSNLAFRDVHVLDSGRTGGLGIQCSVVHYGTGEPGKSSISVLIDDRKVESRLLELAAGETRAVEFSLPELTAGTHSVLLEIDDPELVQDNRFHMTLESGRKIPVLVVEPPAERGRRTPGFFLDKALNIDRLSPFEMTTVSPEDLVISGELLIWNNAPGGGGALQEDLRKFVEDGGGLAVIVADSSGSADFNQSFGSWLPVKVVPSQSDGRNRGRRPMEDYVLMTDVQMDHPIFQPFSRPHSGAFSGARFFRHARLSVDSGVDIPARFDSGDPALVSLQIGKGRVLIFASSADDATNDLPLKAVYPPFWHQMLRYLGNFKENRYWLEVGDIINPGNYLRDASSPIEEDPVAAGEAVAVLGPDKKRLEMAPGTDSLPLDLAGFYEIRSADRVRAVAANTVQKESDLDPGNAEEMTTGWISPEKAVFVPEEKARPEDMERRQRIWSLLLIAVLLLLVSELVVADGRTMIRNRRMESEKSPI